MTRGDKRSVRKHESTKQPKKKRQSKEQLRTPDSPLRKPPGSSSERASGYNSEGSAFDSSYQNGKRPLSEPNKFSGITAALMPHIMVRIVAAATYNLLLSLRETCIALKEAADLRLMRHVVLERRTFFHSTGRRLPFLKLGPMGTDAGAWRANVRVVDVGSHRSRKEKYTTRELNYIVYLLRGLANLQCVRLHISLSWPKDLPLAPCATLVVLPGACEPIRFKEHRRRKDLQELANHVKDTELEMLGIPAIPNQSYPDQRSGALNTPTATAKVVVHISERYLMWPAQNNSIYLRAAPDTVVVFPQAADSASLLCAFLVILSKHARAFPETFRLTFVDVPEHESSLLFGKGEDDLPPSAGRHALIQQSFGAYLTNFDWSDHDDPKTVINNICGNIRLLTRDEYSAECGADTSALELRTHSVYGQ